MTDLCPWPSCSDHYSMVTEHPDFYSWVWTGQCTPHGNVHQWIAGVLNCEDTLGSVGDLVGLENALALGLANFDTRKKLWIFDWFTCESESASTDESLDEVRGVERERKRGVKMSVYEDADTQTKGGQLGKGRQIK